MSKVIGIVGSRRRNSEKDFDLCKEKFDEIFEDGDSIVSGGCPRGGDDFAEIIARRKGISITIHHADWDSLGKVAGFVRNSKIAVDADVLIALVACDRKGGTENTIKKVKNLGKKIIII